MTGFSAPLVAAAAAEQTVNEFWPEINVFVEVSESSRLLLLASFARAREFATSTEATYGIAYDVFASALPSWWLGARPPMEQRWNLWFRLGYNRLEALGGGGGGDENRLFGEATLRSDPLGWGLQLANRSRIEYRDVGQDASWRYRNRSRLERSFTPTEAVGEGLGRSLEWAGVRTLTPYAMLEFFYDSRVSDWNRRLQQYGVELDLRNQRGVEFYVAIQDQNRATAFRVSAVGAVLTFRY